jgi:thermostable 8-oxoguanine DNA glycosylase
MVDPKNITNYDRSDIELEEFLLFSVLVANKPAHVTAKKLDDFLASIPLNRSPLEKIKHLTINNKLASHLKHHKTGQYHRIEKCLKSLLRSELDLKTCSAQDLENIPGIGPKTARFFILHSRRDQHLAALDTHILKFLKELGYNVPKSTPSGNKYRELEKAFLIEAKKLDRDPASLDLEIWRYYHNQVWKYKKDS